LSHLSPQLLSDASSYDSNISLALPGFYCKNKGHQPSYTPFLSVNDGVCDYDSCCDGSDEWQHVGGTKCENRCKEIGKEWKKQDEQNQKAMGLATKKRKELVASAAILRKEMEDRLQSLQTQIEGTTIKVGGLEVALAEVEKRERGKVVKTPGKGSKVGLLAGLAKDRIDELRGALMDVRAQRDISTARVTELEAILTKFKEEYNPNFNDEGVKRAVRAWEDYAARDKPADGGPAHDRDLDEISKPDGETGAIKWEEWEDNDEDDVAARKLTVPRSTGKGRRLTLCSLQL
jgi:protein kinase C substrate 80K-H